MEKRTYIAEYIIAAGYLLFLCAVSVFCLTLSYVTLSQKAASEVNVFATNLPPMTPTPHLPSLQELGASKIFEDKFIDNRNNWTGDEVAKESISGGKLFLESKTEGNYALAICKFCPYVNDPYYLQADFATTAATDKSFGIVFNKSYIDFTFYLFEINTEAKNYRLFHRGKDNWSLCASGESNQIKSFPDSNALGIYINSDTVELYINGKIVDAYQQSNYSFQTGAGYYGFFANNSGFKLTVDNLIVYKTGGQ